MVCWYLPIQKEKTTIFHSKLSNYQSVNPHVHSFDSHFLVNLSCLELQKVRSMEALRLWGVLRQNTPRSAKRVTCRFERIKFGRATVQPRLVDSFFRDFIGLSYIIILELTLPTFQLPVRQASQEFILFIWQHMVWDWDVGVICCDGGWLDGQGHITKSYIIVIFL